MTDEWLCADLWCRCFVRLWDACTSLRAGPVVKEDGASAFVAKPDLRLFAEEIGQAEEWLALWVLIHKIVGDKAIDGLDAVAADLVAADAANMCHAGFLEVMRAWDGLAGIISWYGTVLPMTKRLGRLRSVMSRRESCEALANYLRACA